MNLLFRFITVISLIILLAACGSESSSNETPEPKQPDEPPTAPAPDPTSQSVTLSWVPPTARLNGDPLPLSDIGGYEVYYYREGAPTGEGETLRIANPNVRYIDTPELSVGTYHFAIASYDTEGLYSAISDHITTTLQ